MNSIDHAPRNGPKACVAPDQITSKFDRDVVQRRRIWMPQLWIIHGEDERSPAVPCCSGFDILGVRLVDRYFEGAAEVGATVHSHVD